MKALILAAGKGTRLFPATKSTPKPLMPLAGKATLGYIIDEIVISGISNIGLVVSEDNYNQISTPGGPRSPDAQNAINEAISKGSLFVANISHD